jgi:dihydroneopterin aldolase
VTESHIAITGIRARGRHGASPGERDAPQDFVVDLGVRVEVGADRLDATADYRGVVEAAREAVAEGEYVLLETLARAVVDAVQAVPGVTRVVAVVHKPEAAARMSLGDLSAEAMSG